jgi:hypothetical protein
MSEADPNPFFSEVKLIDVTSRRVVKVKNKHEKHHPKNIHDM